MLERLFTSKTRAEILKLLLFNNQQYHIRGIAKIIGITPTYVKKELENLLKINVVKEARIGNLRLFVGNKDCVFYEDLKSVIYKLKGDK